jgi:hypothetical protein
VLKLTLDPQNCLIDLEGPSPSGALLRLVSASKRGLVMLQVPAVGASERQQDGGTLPSFALFLERLARVDLAHAVLLHPPSYTEFAFTDRSLTTDAASVELERKIHNVLFPGEEFEYAAYCARRGLPPDRGSARSDWRNHKCDVQAMWCHVRSHGDIFVTTDRNFRKATKLPGLIALGAGAVLTPDDALARVAPIGFHW